MSTPTSPVSDTSSVSLNFAKDRRQRRRKKHTMPKFFLQKNLRDEYEAALNNVSANIAHIHRYYSFEKMEIYTKENGGHYPKEFHDLMAKTIDCYHSMRGPMMSRYPIEISHVYQQEIGEIYHKTKFVNLLCAYIVKLYPKRGKTSSERQMLDNCMNLLLDYTNFSEIMVDDIMYNSAMVTLAWHAVQQPMTKAFDNDRKMYVWMLCLLYNCARVPEHRLLMRDKFVSPLFELLARGPKDMELMAILGTLAHVINEHQAKDLTAAKGAIEYIINKLGNALNNYRPFMGRTLESGGWSCMELGEIIRQLARNDSNKEVLFNKGVVPQLIDLASIDDVEKQMVALQAVWNLSFLKQLKPKLAGNMKLMHLVIDLFEIRELQRVASGILWNLQQDMEGKPDFERILLRLREDRDSVEFEDSDEDLNSPILPSFRRTRPIVKLSYNMDNSSLVHRIKEELLKKGYKVRGSDEFQSASIPQAMEMVRRASVIIICISQKYKDSEDCRAEVEHASSLKKAIIPLLLEKNYHPDGWVRDIMNKVAHFRFDNESLHLFEAHMEGLLRQVDEGMTRAASSAPATPQSTRPGTVTEPEENTETSKDTSSSDDDGVEDKDFSSGTSYEADTTTTEESTEPENIKTSKDGPLSDKSLCTLAAGLGREWKCVVLNLDLTDADISQCENHDPGDMHGQIVHALAMWRGRSSDHQAAKLEALISALVAAERLDLAEKLRQRMPEVQGAIEARGRRQTDPMGNEHLRTLAKKLIRRDWRVVAVHLGLTLDDLELYRKRWPMDPLTEIFTALMEWRDSGFSSYSEKQQELVVALQEAGQAELASELASSALE